MKVEASLWIEPLADDFVIDEHQRRVIFLDECVAPPNCRVTRHLPTTSTHEHGSPSETKPNRTILTQGVKMGCIQEDLKLYK